MSLVWFYWIKTTSKNRTIRSPLLLASGIGWTSRTFVRKANLPSLLQANHVPPASPSRPPSISPPCHHARASVGLQKKQTAPQIQNIYSSNAQFGLWQQFWAQHSRILFQFVFLMGCVVLITILGNQAGIRKGKRRRKIQENYTCRLWYSSLLSNRRKG